MDHGIDTLQHVTPVQVRLQKTLFDAIEGWRRKQETIPSRPSAIRELLKKALRQDAASNLNQQGPCFLEGGDR